MKIKVYSEDGQKLYSKYEDNSGFDLRSSLDYIVAPKCSCDIKTGIHVDMDSIDLPKPFQIEAQVRPRSGLAKNNIMLTNTPGTIDKNYLGEIRILLFNNGNETFYIKQGDRIAQLIFTVVLKIDAIDYIEKDEFNKIETSRNSDGFGSTGIK